MKRKNKCERIYNDSKCWNSTGYCEYLNNQEKCPAFKRKARGTKEMKANDPQDTENKIALTLTLRESDFISELLGKSNYGYGSDVRNSVEEKLEGERLKAIKDMMGDQNEILL